MRFGARSAAGSMTPLSLTPNVREHRFQMHHYRGCAGDPLMSWRCEPLSFAYFSLRQAKKSRCLPRTGATLIDHEKNKEKPTSQARKQSTTTPRHPNARSAPKPIHHCRAAATALHLRARAIPDPERSHQTQTQIQQMRRSVN
jgi:hypothetical protein